MKTKHPYLFSLITASLLLQSGASAAPLVSIGDNVDVFFNGSTSLRWESNIYRDEDDEIDDLTWTLSPGLEFNFGRGISNADFSIITRYDIVRYQERDDQDNEMFYISAVGSYQTSRLDLSGSVSFNESNSTSGEANVTGVNVNKDTIDIYNYNASLNGEYRFSPKLSFGSGVSYSKQEYRTYTDLFPDRQTFTVPFDLFYELTPKVDLSAGYSYSQTDVDATPFNVTGDYTRKSHFYNVGLRGNLLPKLSGFFKVGWRTQESDMAGADEESTVGLNADLNWTATPKLSVGLGLSRDLGVGAEGESTVNSSVNLSASYSINSFFSASANLGYGMRDYLDENREENYYNGGLRLSYSPNQHWSFSTGYTYTENESDEVDRSYNSHSIDLTASLRY